MWIFAKGGFLSIVVDRDRPGHLLVRARVKGDIEHFFPNAKIERTEQRDYLYRTSIEAAEVASAVGWHAYNIDYDNFKATITNKNRSLFYNDVWNLMTVMQRVMDNG